MTIALAIIKLLHFIVFCVTCIILVEMAFNFLLNMKELSYQIQYEELEEEEEEEE